MPNGAELIGFWGYQCWCNGNETYPWVAEINPIIRVPAGTSGATGTTAAVTGTTSTTGTTGTGATTATVPPAPADSPQTIMFTGNTTATGLTWRVPSVATNAPFSASVTSCMVPYTELFSYQIYELSFNGTAQMVKVSAMFEPLFSERQVSERNREG